MAERSHEDPSPSTLQTTRDGMLRETLEGEPLVLYKSRGDESKDSELWVATPLHEYQDSDVDAFWVDSDPDLPTLLERLAADLGVGEAREIRLGDLRGSG